MDPYSLDTWGLEVAPTEPKTPPATKTASSAFFTSSEQSRILSEGEGQRARNLDSLDLTGTHYAPLNLDLQGEDDPNFLW